MKKFLCILFILLPLNKAFSCSCNTPKQVLEYYASEYVLEAVAIEKTIAKDSASYKVKFQILKQFKGEKELEYQSFNFQYQKSGELDSCYWEIDEGERWLIYAYNHNGALTFSYNCSNSERLKEPLSRKEQRILEASKKFDPLDYTFNSLDASFKTSRPEKNIDSLLEQLSLYNNYKTKRVDIMVDIDENGNLIAANLTPKKFSERPNKVILDSLFNLNKHPNLKTREPESRAEADILNLAKQLKNWSKVCIPKTSTPVKYRQYLQFHYENGAFEVYY
jgi:hypothetical protein